MFGNKTGWIISAIIVILEGLGMYALYTVSQPSDPTALGRQAAKYVMELEDSPRSLAGSFMTDSSQPGSGEMYLKAIQDFRSHPKDYKEFYERKDFLSKSTQKLDPASIPAPPAELAGIKLLKDATKFQNGRLFSGDASKYGEIINYQTNKQSLEDLGQVVNCTWHMGKWHKAKGEDAEAKACFQAIFSLGVKVYDERLLLEECDKGLGFINMGAGELASLDPSQKQALTSYSESEHAFYDKRVKPIQKVTHTVNANAGDLIEFAKHGGDRMWRIEGLLALGRVKFTADRVGDQKSAIRVLKAISNDVTEEPTIHFAAKLAADLTVEEFRVQGN